MAELNQARAACQMNQKEKREPDVRANKGPFAPCALILGEFGE